MKVNMRNTGFFDLPLELRQSIYYELLPENKTLTYDSSKLWKDQKPD